MHCPSDPLPSTSPTSPCTTHGHVCTHSRTHKGVHSPFAPHPHCGRFHAACCCHLELRLLPHPSPLSPYACLPPSFLHVGPNTFPKVSTQKIPNVLDIYFLPFSPPDSPTHLNQGPLNSTFNSSVTLSLRLKYLQQAVTDHVLCKALA